MSDNNNNNNNANAGEESNSSSRKRKADGTDPSPRGKKLGNDLLATLENPDLCDVTLVGSDGGRVPAVRIYLSARSEMLQNLLVGQFREASEEEVRMDYPAAVLKAIVHFCCTDEAPDLSKLDADIVESMRLAIKLLDAADYYDLDSLRKKAQTAFVDLVNSKHKDDVDVWGRCACSAFEEASRKPSLGKVSRFLYRGIVRNPQTSLIPGGLPGATLLSSTNLRTLVEDPALRARAWTLFQAIQKWLENSAPIDEEVFESDEDRRNFAKQLASNLELRLILPSDLLGPVSNSGLVAQDKIMQALQSQCRGGIVGIYGCGIDGTSIADRVNGIYEEVHMNANYEVVSADDPTCISDKRRFDKITDDIKLTIFTYTDDYRQHFWLVAPPVGAGNVVLTGDFKKIPEENKLLYTGHRRILTEKNDGSDVKWSLSTGSIESADVMRLSKVLPRLVIGPWLRTIPSLLTTELVLRV